MKQHLTLCALSLLSMAVMILACYVGMTNSLCERVKAGAYDSRTMQAIKLDVETCNKPWYEIL